MLSGPRMSIPVRTLNVRRPDQHSQQQSPLFNIPCELRDETYAHYTYEPDGYRHTFQDSGPGELRLSTGAPIDLPLKATCKNITDEMSGVALQTNAIHFHQSDRTSKFSMPSDALRLKRLVEYVNVTKWRMLFLCARECMSDAIVEPVQREYPDHHFIDG
jgi:hypothetical protein